MSTPSGIARAKAMAAGIPVPRRGSLQAKLLQELDFRERNLRSLEFHTLLFFLEEIFKVLTVMLPMTIEDRLAHQQEGLERMHKLLSVYEPELYQERYLPEFEREQQEISRREKAERIRQKEAEQKRHEFVKKIEQT